MSESTPAQSITVAVTYVGREGRWWSVSTIDRASSAAAAYGLRYHETLVWEWDPRARIRGRLMRQDSDRVGSLRVHNAIVERLYLTGQAEEASDGE